MAMHKPGPWIIRNEGNDQVAACREHGYVPTRWVGEVKRGGCGGSKRSGIGAEEVEIMAVEMDGVCYSAGVLDYPE